MALSQAMWIASVGRLGIAVASFHMNLAPFYVMLVMLGMGGGWNWPQALGAVVVGLGVIIAQRSQMPAMAKGGDCQADPDPGGTFRHSPAA